MVIIASSLFSFIQYTIFYQHPGYLCIQRPLVVIHHPHSLRLIALLDDRASDISPLAIDLSKSPYQPSIPSIDLALHDAVNQLIDVRCPALLQVRLIGVAVLEIGEFGAAVPALDDAKDLVLVLAEGVVKGALLVGLDASGGSLLDVDVLDAVVGRVLLDGECDGSDADGLAHHPAHALHGKCVVEGVRERLVLPFVSTTLPMLYINSPP